MTQNVTGPGKILHARFLALGDMTGRSAQDIIAAVGPPTSVRPMEDGGTLMQWSKNGCEMTLLFDSGEQFSQILRQYAHYETSSSGCGPVMGVTIGLLVALALLIGHWV